MKKTKLDTVEKLIRNYGLRPNRASTCCPIGLDHTEDDDDDDDDDDEPLDLGGSSGGLALPLLLNGDAFEDAFEFEAAERFE